MQPQQPGRLVHRRGGPLQRCLPARGLTGSHQQVVLMTIPPGGEIGEEVHPDTDQALLFVAGEGEARLDGEGRPSGHLLCPASPPAWHRPSHL